MEQGCLFTPPEIIRNRAVDALIQCELNRSEGYWQDLEMIDPGSAWGLSNRDRTIHSSAAALLVFLAAVARTRIVSTDFAKGFSVFRGIGADDSSSPYRPLDLFSAHLTPGLFGRTKTGPPFKGCNSVGDEAEALVASQIIHGFFNDLIL